jgi:hypothetical protein
MLRHKAKPGPKPKDITGRRFNRLVALGYVGSGRDGQLWRFRCVCGALKILRKGDVTKRCTQSCGCLQREVRAANGRA